jgi:hypothetical protein
MSHNSHLPHLALGAFHALGGTAAVAGGIATVGTGVGTVAAGAATAAGATTVTGTILTAVAVTNPLVLGVGAVIGGGLLLAKLFD